jgi:cysteinyl-tRNA synthetase
MAHIYSCGPTVYNFAHLGNLRAYVFTDTVRRTLNWKGLAVNHVINITDVGHLTSDADEGDDKMEAAASRAGKTIWEIAAFYTQAFKADLAALNIRTPTVWSVATDHIQDMIAFARRIEEAGASYDLDSGLYFDTSKVPDYGRLAGSVISGAEIGRIESVEGKRQAADFALWRRSAPGEQRQMEWMSPWGLGAPGWHLECSVMSIKYLGAQFDIHTGGIDHREIHHCNEIAQNQAFTGTDHSGANFWMHNNFLVAKNPDGRGGKMSKSKGGFATLAGVIDRGVHPLAYRMLCLSAHYRSELEFSPDALSAALTRLSRIVMAVSQIRSTVGMPEWTRLIAETEATRGASFDYQRSVLESGLDQISLKLIEQFDKVLSDDLMVPQAIPLLEQALADRGIPPEHKLRLVASLDLALGFGLLTLGRADLRIRPSTATVDQQEIESLLAARQEARSAKDFTASDRIRDDLAAKGVSVMDGAGEIAWDWMIEL